MPLNVYTSPRERFDRLLLARFFESNQVFRGTRDISGNPEPQYP